jgi:hypothetical protein
MQHTQTNLQCHRVYCIQKLYPPRGTVAAWHGAFNCFQLLSQWAQVASVFGSTVWTPFSFFLACIGTKHLFVVVVAIIFIKELFSL